MTEKYQSRIISEIIETEKNYLNQLEKIQNFFSKPCLEKGLTPSHVHSAIFGQLSAIYQMNSRLLEEILCENEYEATVNIGKAFLKLGPFLKVYSSYAKNFQQSLTILQKLESDSEPFKVFISANETRPEVQAKLTSLLIAPIQRIPRYKLLLEELIKYSPLSSPSYEEIQGALHQVTEAAEHINQSVDDSQSLKYLLLLQKALRNQQPNIIVPGRKLLKEGVLNKVSRKGKGSQERLFFLFSDMLMYTKLPPSNIGSGSVASLASLKDVELKPNTLECCCTLPLRHCKVTRLLGSKDQGITFRLQCSEEDLLLYSASSLEGESWIKAIVDASKEAQKKRKTLRKESSRRRARRKTPLKKFPPLEEEESSPAQETKPSKFSIELASRKESLRMRLRHARDCLTPPRISSPSKTVVESQAKNCRNGLSSTSPNLTPAESSCSNKNLSSTSPVLSTSRRKSKKASGQISIVRLSNSPTSKENHVTKTAISDSVKFKVNRISTSPVLTPSNPLNPKKNFVPTAVNGPLNSLTSKKSRVSTSPVFHPSNPLRPSKTLVPNLSSSASPFGLGQENRWERRRIREPPPLSPLATCSWQEGSSPQSPSSSFVFKRGVRGREGSQLTPSPSPSSSTRKPKRPISEVLSPTWVKQKLLKKD